MDKLLAILLTITTVFIGSGCLSSAYHITGQGEYPYNGTTDCWNHCICVWEREPKTEVEQAMDAYTRMVYLFWVVDFPLEVVLDTVLFPFDGIIYMCQNSTQPKKIDLGM